MTVDRPERPLLKPWYRLARDGDARLLFEYGHAVVAFDGRAVARLLPALLPLLDGTRTVDEVVRVLGEEVRPRSSRRSRYCTGIGS